MFNIGRSTYIFYTHYIMWYSPTPSEKRNIQKGVGVGVPTEARREQQIPLGLRAAVSCLM